MRMRRFGFFPPETSDGWGRNGAQRGLRPLGVLRTVDGIFRAPHQLCAEPTGERTDDEMVSFKGIPSSAGFTQHGEVSLGKNTSCALEK